MQISYAIGVAEPLSISVFSYGSSKMSHKELLQVVKNNFDLRPGRIIKLVLVTSISSGSVQALRDLGVFYQFV